MGRYAKPSGLNARRPPASAIVVVLAACTLSQASEAPRNDAERPLPALAFHVGRDFAAWQGELRRRLGEILAIPTDRPRELQSTLRGFGEDAELRFRGREVAFRAPKNTPLVRAFLRAIRAQGERPAFQVKSGTSDMNVVGPHWKCPILAYGPGDASLDHTPHEHIDLREYHRAIGVLVSVLEHLQQDLA